MADGTHGWILTIRCDHVAEECPARSRRTTDARQAASRQFWLCQCCLAPKEVDMALSDQLTALSDRLAELSARAKQAEEHAAVAREKSKEDLNADVETARASAQAQAKKLRESAEANKNKLSVWW